MAFLEGPDDFFFFFFLFSFSIFYFFPYFFPSEAFRE